MFILKGFEASTVYRGWSELANGAEGWAMCVLIGGCARRWKAPVRIAGSKTVQDWALGWLGWGSPGRLGQSAWDVGVCRELAGESGPVGTNQSQKTHVSRLLVCLGMRKTCSCSEMDESHRSKFR